MFLRTCNCRNVDDSQIQLLSINTELPSKNIFLCFLDIFSFFPDHLEVGFVVWNIVGFSKVLGEICLFQNIYRTYCLKWLTPTCVVKKYKTLFHFI